MRQAAGRNAPSAINAVFNFRNFWDGRANNDFNSLDVEAHGRVYRPVPDTPGEIISSAWAGRWKGVVYWQGIPDL